MGHGFIRMNTDFSDFIRFECLICVNLCPDFWILVKGFFGRRRDGRRMPDELG
jgi:hypothetical protein